MTNTNSGSVFLLCTAGRPDTWEAPGIEIDWIPERTEQGSVFPAHYRVGIYENPRNYSRLLTIHVASKQFTDFCTAFALEVRKADDDRKIVESGVPA